MVKLKSGGPHMTIEHLWKNAHGVLTARCAWFDGTENKTGSFPVAGLEAVQAEGVSAT
jgi:uncharacterized protein YodC (DUF2158 family)